jgi:putative ABC transport system ATP-binding protein
MRRRWSRRSSDRLVGLPDEIVPVRQPSSAIEAAGPRPAPRPRPGEFPAWCATPGPRALLVTPAFSGSGRGAGPVPAFHLHAVRQVRAGTRILDGVDLEFPQRRLTALVGPSGAGKTSLLRLLNRLDEPTGGMIEYRGQPLHELPVRQLRRRVGFVFQAPVMFAGTVRDNLREAVALAGHPVDDLESAMYEAMALAELEAELLDRDGDRLSLGQKQRANLARALMCGPEALLMDEPTSALDPETADRLMDTVRRMSAERALTIVMVTHRLAEAQRVSDLTVVLEAGRVLTVGPTPEVFAQTADPRLRAFLESGR